MMMSDSAVWAIEAKWTEPRYETVAKRISKQEADGADPRKTVEGWLKHFRPFTECDLRIEAFENVVYQTLHRAASACAVATARKLRPELVYLALRKQFSGKKVFLVYLFLDAPQRCRNHRVRSDIYDLTVRFRWIQGLLP